MTEQEDKELTCLGTLPTFFSSEQPGCSTHTIQLFYRLNSQGLETLADGHQSEGSCQKTELICVTISVFQVFSHHSLNIYAFSVYECLVYKYAHTACICQGQRSEDRSRELQH